MFLTLMGKKLTEKAVVIVKVLSSTEEEIDTKILLHAVDSANSGYSSVVIASVFILCIAFSGHVARPLYLKGRSKTHVLYVDIKKVALKLGLHAFSGCDTISAFAGRGKLLSLKLLIRS